MAIRIVREQNPTLDDVRILETGIADHGRAKLRDWGHESLAFFLRDEDNAIVGGIYGNSGFGWLYISDLWVAEHLRGTGYGSELMQRAESEAAERGCQHVFLNTFSFQAPDFYKNLGYEVFAELKDFPEGHSRYFLKKDLPRYRNMTKSREKQTGIPA
jgi:ribosomal protein S18 acetylase RimI-like enzyme